MAERKNERKQMVREVYAWEKKKKARKAANATSLPFLSANTGLAKVSSGTAIKNLLPA